MKCRFCPEQVKRGDNAPDRKKPRRICPECWCRPFYITGLCRADLGEYLSESQIVKFDDVKMEILSSRMANAYCDQVFWIDLQIIAKSILEDV